MISKDKAVFRPGIGFVILNVCYSIAYLYLFFSFVLPYIFHMRSGLDLIKVIRKKDYLSALTTLPWITLYMPSLFSTVILAPVIRKVFSCVISPEFICGAESIVPFLAFPVKIEWNAIKRVGYLDLFFLKYYVFYDGYGRKMIYIPCDLGDFENFKKEVFRCAPAQHIFKAFLKNEKRSFLFPSLKVGLKMDSELSSLYLYGQVVPSKNGPQKTYALMKIKLYYNEFLASEFQTNQKGEFNHTFDYFEGEYTLIAEGYGVKVEKKVGLPWRGKEGLQIEI